MSALMRSWLWGLEEEMKAMASKRRRTGRLSMVCVAFREFLLMAAIAHASILREGAGPFTPAHEILMELPPGIRHDIDIEEITDALDRFTLATFVWVAFRPDQAGKLWKGKGKDGDNDSMRTTVHHRNGVLYLAWKVFWAILPTDIAGNETALVQWLDLATIVRR